MKIEARHNDRAPTEITGTWQIVVEGRDGQRFEITEQMTGGFTVTAIMQISSQIAVIPRGSNQVLITTR